MHVCVVQPVASIPWYGDAAGAIQLYDGPLLPFVMRLMTGNLGLYTSPTAPVPVNQNDIKS